MSVLVSVPYWRSRATVRRCVESILAQTHTDLLCVVINDGDTQSSPWPTLEGIGDRRLLRFDLPINRGRYFVDAVAAQAADGRCEWWMPVDCDDYLEPGRLAALLKAAGPDVDVVMSPWTQHHPDGRGYVRGLRLPAQGRPIRAVAHLSSLWRPGFARLLCWPGQRVAWDQVMTTAAWHYGRVATVGDAGYHRVIRGGSLSYSRETGRRTAYRRAAKREQRQAWRLMLREIDFQSAAAVLAAQADRRLGREATREADRLRTLMEVR